MVTAEFCRTLDWEVRAFGSLHSLTACRKEASAVDNVGKKNYNRHERLPSAARRIGNYCSELIAFVHVP